MRQFSFFIYLLLGGITVSAQTLEQAWFFQSPYTFGKMDIQKEQMVWMEYTDFRISDLDTLGLDFLAQAEAQDTAVAKIYLKIAQTDTSGVLITGGETAQDSSFYLAGYRILAGGGMVQMSSDRQAYAKLPEARRAANDYEWDAQAQLEARTGYSRDQLEQLLNAPDLTQVSLEEVLDLTRRHNRYKPLFEEYINAIPAEDLSSFRLSTMNNRLLRLLFIQQGYSPYKSFEVHPFERYKDDPKLQALLKQGPQSILRN